jgi:hypothetical protein
MKILITEEQNLRIKKAITKLLNHEFKDSNVVCEIVVNDVDEEEYDYEVANGLKYDIIVYINEKFTRTGGIYGFRIATEKKINELLLNWLNMKVNEYSIWTLVKDC